MVESTKRRWPLQYINGEVGADLGLVPCSLSFRQRPSLLLRPPFATLSPSFRLRPLLPFLGGADSAAPSLSFRRRRRSPSFQTCNRTGMADVMCPACKQSTEIFQDYAAGDMVCTGCGLVLESHFIDETCEWRTFANESARNDPVRVGDPSNPLFTDGHLVTFISSNTSRRGRGRGSQGDLLSFGRWQNPGSNPNLPFCSIASMADRLGLVATIKAQAYEIYKNVEDLKSIRGRIRNQNAVLAACLYIACRQEDKPRTIREICSIANGASKEDIVRAKDFIMKHLEEELGTPMDMGTTHARDFLRRFCSHLGMNNQSVKAATECVDKLEEVLDVRRSPISIAAAVIYMISQLSHDQKSLKDISHVTGVTEGTIRNSYKDVFPHASKIVPDWFAQLEGLKA